MQLNVLDDLAEAMKALDGKKDGHVLGTLCAVTMALLTNRLDLCIQGLFGAFFPSNAFMASARSFNTLYDIAKAVIANWDSRPSTIEGHKRELVKDHT